MSRQPTDAERKAFITAQHFRREEDRKAGANRGRLVIASCRSGSYLARAVVDCYNSLSTANGVQSSALFMDNIDRCFSDYEICVRLENHVSGCDAYLFQSLFDPTSERDVNQNYMAFLIAARALKEHGANHVTGVLPYLAYARQDKPTTFTREPTTARLMADISATAGIDRLVAWDPHCDQLRGFYGGMPVNMLDPLTLFLEEFERFRGRQDVIAIAPDAGAGKFVTEFGRALDVNCGIGSKYRPTPEKVIVSEIIGDFGDKKIALVIDDMISNGGTTYALIKKLVEEKGIEEVYLGVSHNLCVAKGLEHLMDMHKNLNLKEVVITNSIPQTPEITALPFVRIHCLSEVLCRAINRIHYDSSVSDVFYSPNGHEG